MKRHPGWLAAGLLIFAVLACNLSKNNNNSNNSNSNSTSNKNSNSPVINRPANADVYVDSISMARDNNGKPGAATTTYEVGDHKVHCVVGLNKAKGGTQIKFVWKAVDVASGQNGEMKTTNYTTKSFENKVNANLTKPADWSKGSYRVEVYINGNLDKTIDYTVE